MHLESHQQIFRSDHHDEAGRLIGSLVGIIENRTFTSGHRAPFGGIDLVRDWEPPERVASLVDHALDDLRHAGVKTAKIRCKPASWSVGEVVIQQALMQAGFAVEVAELSFSIDTRTTSSYDEYKAGLKKESRKALGKAESLGLVLDVLETDDDWQKAFELLVKNRGSKGRPMNMTWDYLNQVRKTFPNRIQMIALSAESMVAAALSYRVGPERDVVVRWGDSDHDLPYSPMYLLAGEVIGLSIKDGVKVIDLGIATEAGKPNPGLVQFKRAIGAAPELRLDLILEMD